MKIHPSAVAVSTATRDRGILDKNLLQTLPPELRELSLDTSADLRAAAEFVVGASALQIPADTRSLKLVVVVGLDERSGHQQQELPDVAAAHSLPGTAGV